MRDGPQGQLWLPTFKLAPEKRKAFTLHRVHGNIPPMVVNGHVYAPNDPAQRTGIAHGHLTLTEGGAAIRFLGDDGTAVTFTRQVGPLACAG